MRFLAERGYDRVSKMNPVSDFRQVYEMLAGGVAARVEMWQYTANPDRACRPASV